MAITNDIFGASYGNGVIPFFHKDGNGNIISKEVTGRTYTIKESVVVLEEFPDLQYGFDITISNLNGKSFGNTDIDVDKKLARVEKNYLSLNENEYIVDITTGFVHFHPNLNGVEIKVDNYYGKGLWLIDDTRIIADIIKKRNADGTYSYDYKNLADTIASAKGFISKGEWYSETIYDINNIVEHKGIIYIAKSENWNQEPSSNPSYWDVVIDVNSIIEDHADDIASDSNYGHVKLTNATYLDYGVNKGVAATPKAVKDVMDKTIGNTTAIDTHIGDIGNPHKVTKAQVELGNVPNVSTNNQTPTYTMASTLSNLSSGEKLSTAFSKISKAISDYITNKDDVEETLSELKSAINHTVSSEKVENADLDTLLEEGIYYLYYTDTTGLENGIYHLPTIYPDEYGDILNLSTLFVNKTQTETYTNMVDDKGNSTIFVDIKVFISQILFTDDGIYFRTYQAPNGGFSSWSEFVTSDQLEDTISKHTEIEATEQELGHVYLTSDLDSMYDEYDGYAATPLAINQLNTRIKEHSTATQKALDELEVMIENSGGDGSQTTDGGFVGGEGASAISGGAIGYNASATDGGAIGCDANAGEGGAVGIYAYSTNGGAIGSEARTAEGFAGGYQAKTVVSEYNDTPIDAIQLGTGVNINEKTLQVYDYKLMDADGNIPSERLNNVTKTQVGLGNVDNTSDLNKPISIAMRTALDGKLNVIQYLNKDLDEITTDGIYMLTYNNTWNFDKSLYNLPDGYNTDTLDVYFGNHDMWLIVTAMMFTDDAPEDRKYEYHGAQFLYTKDGLFIREFEKPHQNELYYFNSWYNSSVTAEEIGLGNVENKSSATIRSELTKENVTAALSYTPTEANIKKNPSDTTGDIIDTHLTIGIRSGTIGTRSLAIGVRNIAASYNSFSSGIDNSVSGNYNDASFIGGGSNNTNTSTSEGRNAIIGGKNNSVSGNCSVICGGHNNTATLYSGVFSGGHSTVSGWYSVVLGGNHANALANNAVLGHYNKTPTAGGATGSSGDALIIGNGASSTATSNCFRVAYDGNAYATAAMNSTGADYAECFEWVDGNPENEDRVGLMTAFEGDKIRLANSSDPIEIIGIISAIPAVVGDNYADEWCGKYQKDKYGRMITEHKVYAEVLDDEGIVIKSAYEADEYVLNPDYNPDEKYIPRLERPEYDAVGTHGKLVVRDDGSCKVGGFCRSGENGIATASESGFYVMERIDDETIRVYIR